MSLQVYSTLTRKKEPFPKKPGQTVSMYVCGPTVYKPSHIGHMVGPVIFDTVKRYLQYQGYKVRWVVNITDVDDKLIEQAKKLQTTVTELAERMTQDYMNCLERLNVIGIDHLPRATQYIDGMVAMIERLIDKGHAYPAGGDVYFDVSRDEDYGKLCNRDPEQLESGARSEVNTRKRNPGDFALWKAAKPDEPAEVQFTSPWGRGRPGWHIECSVMSQQLLGETIDIHGGGLDLQFPHHENELAQSECDTGHPFARIWMHNGLLRLRTPDGKDDKMAGSKGNVLNVADAFAQGVSGDVLRFFLLNTHYRSPIDLGTWDPSTEPLPSAMDQARKGFDTFRRFADRYERITGHSFYDRLPPRDPRRTLSRDLSDYHTRFCQLMDDDFNTGGAVGVLFELTTVLNRIADAGRLDDAIHRREQSALVGFTEGVGFLKEMGQILGLFFEKPAAPKLGGGDELVNGLMQLLIDLRNNLRATAKGIADKADPTKKALFDQTDLIRTRLATLGVSLEDRPDGTTWRVG